MNWHFDRSEYSVSLILQPSIEGGFFQFAPNSREDVKAWLQMPSTAEDVSNCLAMGEESNSRKNNKVKQPQLSAGDLYLFRGQNSLHRVSEIMKGTRINLILTYNSTPGVELNNYTLKKFFGVVSGLVKV